MTELLREILNAELNDEVATTAEVTVSSQDVAIATGETGSVVEVTLSAEGMGVDVVVMVTEETEFERSVLTTGDRGQADEAGSEGDGLESDEYDVADICTGERVAESSL